MRHGSASSGAESATERTAARRPARSITVGSKTSNPRNDRRLFYSKSVDPDRAILSNFALCGKPIVDADGRRYSTVEHFYQAAKFVHAGDNASAINFTVDAAEDEQAVGRAGADAKLAADSAYLVLDGWDGVRDEVMRRAVAARARSDAEFVRALRASCGSQLLHYEATGAKSYWGGTFTATGHFEGRNRLGDLLMELRQQLVEPSGPSTTDPSPPRASRHSGASFEISRLVVAADRTAPTELSSHHYQRGCRRGTSDN